MFKLVVLSALVALVAAKPSGIALGYTAYAAPAVALPAAVSHQYRSDIISSPVVQKTIVAAAPAVVAAPVALSSAITHQSRIDLQPTLLAASPVAYAAHAHAPLVHAW